MPGPDHLYPGRTDGGKAVTWSDPIVEEVRRVRDAYAARFDYDLHAIFRDLKEQEKRSGRKSVSFARAASEAESSASRAQEQPPAHKPAQPQASSI